MSAAPPDPWAEDSDDGRLLRLSAAVIGGVCDMPPETLLRGTRGGAAESLVRQFQWCIMRRARAADGLDLSFERIGELCGRDRSTVGHGVEAVEALAEADPDIERALSMLTMTVRQLARAQPPLLAALRTGAIEARTLAAADAAEAEAVAQAEARALADRQAGRRPARLGARPIKHAAAVEALVDAAQKKRRPST